MTTLDLSVRRPQPGPQVQFLSSRADIAIYGGAAGGGKTYALLLEAARHHANPNFSAVIFRRTYPQVTNPGGLWDESCSLFPLLEADPKRQSLSWEFPSGAKVKFGHLQHDDDVLSWQGSQIPLIAFDELTHFSERQFFYLLSRNRSTCGVRPYVRASCNPDADSWVSKFIAWWIDPEEGYPIPERSGALRWMARIQETLYWADTREELLSQHPNCIPKSVTFIAAKLSDNRILMRKDPGYLANLMALPLVERERLLAGNWKIRLAPGNFFRREWFNSKIVRSSPVEAKRIRYWDRAACLIPGTLVETASGQVPIERVSAGDWVMTRKGLCRVQWAGVSGFVNEIASVLFSNGSVVAGTHDHPVWDEHGGWTDLAKLNTDCRCLSRLGAMQSWAGQETPVWNRSSSMACITAASLGGGISRQCGTTGRQKNTGPIHCTGPSGGTITATYPVAVKFITRTRTGTTTRLKILNASLLANTTGGTAFLSDGHERRLFGSINARFAELVSRLLQRPVCCDARNVARNGRQPRWASLHGSALQPAGCDSGTARFRRFAAAVQNSWAGRRQSIAHVVEPRWAGLPGSIPVYDLQVDGEHEFFANGVLVHNTEDGGCFTCGELVSRTTDGRYFVEHEVRGQWSSRQRDQIMLATAIHDRHLYGQNEPYIWIEEEGGSSGKDSIIHTAVLLDGYPMTFEKPTGKKEVRAESFASQCEAGNVYLVDNPERKWDVHGYIDELCGFPAGYQDRVDATCSAYNKLKPVPGRTVIGDLLLHPTNMDYEKRLEQDYQVVTVNGVKIRLDEPEEDWVNYGRR